MKINKTFQEYCSFPVLSYSFSGPVKNPTSPQDYQTYKDREDFKYRFDLEVTLSQLHPGNSVLIRY